MAQPDVAAVMLSDPLLLNQGLLSRCLVTAPESNAGTRLWREPFDGSDVAIKRYGGRILDMLEKPLPLVAGKSNELSPRVLQLAPDARRLWIGFADNIESQIKPDGALAPVRGLANKLPEHAARLAAVLALVSDFEVNEIAAEQMAAGIMLAQHYVAEALRMFEGSRIKSELILAQRLLGWLQRLLERERDITAGHIPARSQRNSRQGNRHEAGKDTWKIMVGFTRLKVVPRLLAAIAVTLGGSLRC